MKDFTLGATSTFAAGPDPIPSKNEMLADLNRVAALIDELGKKEPCRLFMVSQGCPPEDGYIMFVPPEWEVEAAKQGLGLPPYVRVARIELKGMEGKVFLMKAAMPATNLWCELEL